MSTAAGSPESDSRKVSKSREDSSIQQGHLEQQQELPIPTSATSRHQQQKGDPQQKGCQKQQGFNQSTSISRDANSTVKTPTTRGVSRKTRWNGEKFVKKDTKRVKILNFGPIDFTQFDSYPTIGSPMLLVLEPLLKFILYLGVLNTYQISFRNLKNSLSMLPPATAKNV